jgi:hypothetical protein
MQKFQFISLSYGQLLYLHGSEKNELTGSAIFYGEFSYQILMTAN